MTIKVGDKVKVLAEYSGLYNNVGWVTEVVSLSGLPYTVVFDDEGDFNFFAEDELELVK